MSPLASDRRLLTITMKSDFLRGDDSPTVLCKQLYFATGEAPLRYDDIRDECRAAESGVRQLHPG